MDGRNQTGSPGPGGSNLSPSTYQINVSRRKTKKWVNAKVQNYDGDDWGAPESEEEDDTPVAPPPPLPRPAGGQRLPSESRVAGQGRSASGQPTFPVPTAQPPVEQSVPAVTRPSNLGGPLGGSDNVVLPQSGGPTSGQPEPVLLPASTYEQQPNQQSLGPQPLNVESVGEFDADGKRVSVSPQLPNVSRMSGFGVDFFSAGVDPSINREPTVQEEREPTPQPAAQEPFSVPTVKETEATPTDSTLPSTTFPAPPVVASNAEPEKTGAPRRPSLPGQYVTEDPTNEVLPTPLSPPLEVNEPEVSPISEHAPKGPAGSSAGVSDADSQRLVADAKSLPPLRTPSPHEPRTVPPAVEDTPSPTALQSTTSEQAQPDIVPTEPLQPKSAQDNYTPSDYGSQPLSRQYTVDTVTSSPVKESDVLSDEIMRTLTPGGLTSPTDAPEDKRKSQIMPTGRESSYTLSGYDDYWADTADKRKSMAPGALDDVPEVPPIPTVAPTEVKAPEAMPGSPEPLRSPNSDSQASLRRRFSWEAPDENQGSAPAVAAAKAAATAAAAKSPTSPSASVPEASKPEKTERTISPSQASPASPTINVISDAPSITHQISQASSKPATQPTPEPPSPVSELSDRDATPLAQPIVSPDDGNGMPMASPLSSNPVSASHGEAQTPKIASPTPMAPGKSIATFREIMEVPSTKGRIAKYEETRSVFASQDSGLDNWLTTMRTEYPEHAKANGSFSGMPLAAPQLPAGGAAGPQAPQTDQPYYQQYLQANANAPSANASQTGSARSRIAGYSTQAQTVAGSAFGDGGKQIGTKGKEFMHTAGKMGKGLFSKGKSKIQQAREAREARGEKGETSPPPVDRKPQRPERPDRRMSWTLKKSRENGPAPPEATAGHGHERNESSLSGVSVEPPRLAEPARMSPFLSNPSPTNGDEGVFWQDTSSRTDTTHEAEPRYNAGVPDGQGVQASQAQQQQQQRNEPPPNEDSDWVLVPRQSADQRDTVAAAQPAHHPSLQPLHGAVHQEDSGIGMASQSPDTRPDAQRHSSFRGLPPIRRNSSFGLSAFDANQAGRVSPIENDDVPAQYDTSASAAQNTNDNGNGTLSPHENATQRSVGVDSNATLIGQDSTTRTGRSSMSLSKEPMRFQPPQQQQPLQVDTQMPHQQESQPGQPGQPQAVNPIQRTPPSGWQLNESHLAAPLHVARRRAGTDSSQQQVTYGFDKETGASIPMSPTSPEAGPAPSLPQPSGRRTSDVPPSSARRYPDLFRPAQQSPQQRDRAGSGGQPMVGYQQYQPHASQEGNAPQDKALEAGYYAPTQEHDEAGKRTASDIFKGIGGRFKKTDSEERRNSVNSGAGFERTDTMNSMNSQGQVSQKKKKRSSFLSGALRPRPSMDAVPPPGINDLNRPVTQENTPGPERSGTPQSEKRRSLLGGKFSAAQAKFLPGGLPGSQRGASTSNLANDSNSVGGTESVNGSMGPPKKRFTGFTDKAATFTGRFRSSGDHQKHEGNMPQDPAAMSQSSLPPPPPPKSRGRSASAASAGSHGMAPPPAPGAESDERRGRRGSFQGMVSSMMGRSSSKTRYVEEQQPPPQGQFVHQHPGAPSQQQYGGQGPYPPMQGQMSPPGQYPHQPPQGEQGRGPSMDAGQRANRHLSGQFVQPPRPSPLAQESSAAAPQSVVQNADNRVVSPPPPSNLSERAVSPSLEPSEGPVSHMPFKVARKPTRSGPHPSVAAAAVAHAQESVSSSTISDVTEQPTQSVAGEHHVESQPIQEVSRSSTPRNDPPLSPVKRQLTPHATALFASMSAPPEDPQPPISSVPQQQHQQEPVHTALASSPDATSAGPSGYARTESAASSRVVQSATGFAPSREATPVQSAVVQGPPSAGRPSGSQQGSPAQTVQPDGRFSPPQAVQNPQFQNAQQGSPIQTQGRFSPPQSAHVAQFQKTQQGSPAQTEGRFSPPQAGQNPQFQNPQQGLPGQTQQPDGRFSPPQPGQPPQFQNVQQQQQFPLQFMQHRPQGAPPQLQFSQQQGPRPGPPQGPQPGAPQSQQQPAPGFQQGFNPQQGPRPQGPPQGPQQGFQQNGPGQPQPAQPQGQESKLKGWKNRMSTQMANIKAQSQGQDKPQQVPQQGQQGLQVQHQGQQGQQVQHQGQQGLQVQHQGQQGQQVQHQGQQGQQAPHQGQQPPKESWKDRLANMAPSSQVKHEQSPPPQQTQGQSQHGSWKDRLANMAPSAQVKTQQPQGQGQQLGQPQLQFQPPDQPQAQIQQPSQPQSQPQHVQQPGQPQNFNRPNGSVPGAQVPQPQLNQHTQGGQPQTTPLPQAQFGQGGLTPQRTQTPQAPQAHAPQPSPAKPEKSSWRSRVSGLGAIGSQSSQDKQDKPEKGDKPSTGDKFFGALKRVSKPGEQPPPPPPKNGPQPPHQGQWRPSAGQQAPLGASSPQPGQGRQHPFNPNDAYSQYAQQPQMRPQQNMPPGQQFQQYPPQQQPQQWQGQQQPGQPAGPQQQWSYGQQMAVHHQQQPTRAPEPQYDQVPIPKGYGQVQGEYNNAQRMAQGQQPVYQGQMHPQQAQQYYQGQHPPQQQQMQQQAYHRGGQMSPPPQQQQSQSGLASSVPQGMQGQQVNAGRESPASPPEQGGFDLPIQGSITPGEPDAPQLPLQGAQQQPHPQQVQQQQTSIQAQVQQQEQQQQMYALERPRAVRGDTHFSDTGRSMESGVMGGMGQRVLPHGQAQHGHHLQPQPSTTSMNEHHISDEASQAPLAVGSAAQPKPTEVSRPTSLSPDVVVQEPQNNLAIDVEKSKQDVDNENIYDATPRLKQEATGGSHGVSDQSSANEVNDKQLTPETATTKAVAARETDTSPPMELEDTNDARMRTLRIGSQEEKIFYDPEGDVPKMSATSYPGQEWNPYGEPEFADFKDD